MYSNILKYTLSILAVVCALFFYYSNGKESLDSAPSVFVPLIIDENSGQDVASNISDVWRLLPESGSACRSSEPYGVDGGVRTLFCRALLIYSWKSFVALSPVPIFIQGPHANGKLNLDSSTDFGYYNPQFVTWAASALIPGASNSKIRIASQNVYDTQIKQLARIYFEVNQKLIDDPLLLERERVSYLSSLKDLSGNVSQNSNFWVFLGSLKDDFGDYDSNHVRSSVMWWLRRYQDKTAPLWHKALFKLLSTYDSDWLEKKKVKTIS